MSAGSRPPPGGQDERGWIYYEAAPNYEAEATLDYFCFTRFHGRMARGIHGLPKLSLGPAIPNPSTPGGRAACAATVFYPFGHPTLYAYFSPVAFCLKTCRLESRVSFCR
jgi:hypothetical protein